jgi:hypothetical protein
VRVWVLAALLVGAASTLAGCGSGSSPNSPPSASAPLTFTATTPVPTSTVATPTSRAYVGPNGLPVETGAFLAPATTTQLGEIVDDIQCQSLSQLAYRAYAHLQVYVDGQSRALPGGIGLVGLSPETTAKGLFYGANTCEYWLHTRAADGLIEVESPRQGTYTLGDFFEIWNQPLSPDRVGPNSGKVTAIVNGKHWHGDPTRIPLTEHESIELAVGRPVPRSTSVDWLGTHF